MNIKTIFKLASKHAPEIMTVCAIGGVITTIGLTVRATLGIEDAISELETNDTLEIAKSTVSSWAPAAASAGLTIASIVMAHKYHLKREAIFLATAAMWQDKYKNIEKYLKTNVKDGEKLLNGAKAKEMHDKLPDQSPKLRPGEILVYEPMSKQFFISSNQEITSAELIANKVMQREEALTLNEFLKLFRNAHTSTFGDSIGWFKTSDQWKYAWDLYGQSWIDIVPYKAEIKGRTCVYLDYGVKMTTEDPMCPPAIQRNIYNK